MSRQRDGRFAETRAEYVNERCREFALRLVLFDPGPAGPRRAGTECRVGSWEGEAAAVPSRPRSRERRCSVGAREIPLEECLSRDTHDRRARSAARRDADWRRTGVARKRPRAGLPDPRPRDRRQTRSSTDRGVDAEQPEQRARGCHRAAPLGLPPSVRFIRRSIRPATPARVVASCERSSTLGKRQPRAAAVRRRRPDQHHA